MPQGSELTLNATATTPPTDLMHGHKWHRDFSTVAYGGGQSEAADASHSGVTNRGMSTCQIGSPNESRSDLRLGYIQSI